MLSGLWKGTLILVFHRKTIQSKSYSIIWKINYYNGMETRIFTVIVDEGIRHFSYVYKDPKITTIMDIISISGGFNQILTKEDIEDLLKHT